MTPLKNAKHEAFARAIVEGKSGRDAYRAAGYEAKDRAADANASRLLATANVAARVEELKKAAAAGSVMTLAEVLAELSKLGRSSIADCIVEGDDTGEVFESIRDMRPEYAAAIQEITTEYYTEGVGDNAREVKRVKVKLHDKKGALSELRRHFEPQTHEHSGPGGKPIEHQDKTERPGELELARRIAFALEKGARAKANEPPPAARPKQRKRA